MEMPHTTDKRTTLAMMTWLVPTGLWIGSFLLGFSGALNYAPELLNMILGALRLLALPWGFVTAVLVLRKTEITQCTKIHARTGAFLCGTAGILLISLFVYLVYLPRGELPFWISPSEPPTR